MRYLVQVSIPNEPFNTYAREGTAGQRISRVIEETKPKSIYFTGVDGQRGAVAIYELDQDSQIPSICEPWFLTFNATLSLQIAMTPEDLQRAQLDNLGKKWR